MAIFDRTIFFCILLLALFGCGGSEFELTDEGSSTAYSSVSFSGIDSIDQVTDTSAKVNWTDNASASLYTIYNMTSGVPVVVAVVDAPASSYDVLSLSVGTGYVFRVQLTDLQGLVDSNTKDVSFTTNSAPDVPSGLTLLSPATSPNSDDTPTITVNGVKSGDTIKLFTDASCTTQVGSTVSTGTTADITSSSLALGAYTLYANATGTNASSCSTASVSYEVTAPCPTGYINVPANASLGVNAFCVMQFEAKNVAGIATSQAASAPWASINQTDSKTACTALGANYDLISNAEWMTIAINIESVDSNWSGSAVGSGMLNRGHSDSNPAVVLEVTNTSDPYDGTGNNSGQAAGSGWEQARRHTLDNGATIWDFAGNVWEWADWSLGGGLTGGPTSCVAAWTELPVVACGALASAEYMPENPSAQAAATYNSTYGLGKFYGGAGGGAQRGGSWVNISGTGVYALRLSNLPSTVSTAVGFRCVYRP